MIEDLERSMIPSSEIKQLGLELEEKAIGQKGFSGKEKTVCNEASRGLIPSQERLQRCI